jgi:hypothetical protein
LNSGSTKQKICSEWQSNKTKKTCTHQKNYKTKKAIKDDLIALQECISQRSALPQASNEYGTLTTRINRLQNGLTVYQPNGDITGVQPPSNGSVTLEGPHYPEPHRWYAQATIENGVVVKVK